MYAHAALLALSREPCQYTGIWRVAHVSDLQSMGPPPERMPATTIIRVGILEEKKSKKNRLEAVRIMLPPLRGFPRASFVCFIAADACLTARKQLIEV